MFIVLGLVAIVYVVCWAAYIIFLGFAYLVALVLGLAGITLKGPGGRHKMRSHWRFSLESLAGGAFFALCAYLSLNVGAAVVGLIFVLISAAGLVNTYRRV